MEKYRMILLEFNELCPHLLDQWMSEGRLPNFKKFYNNSELFITEADANKAPHLNPWIQWYSIHTGMHYEKHEVFHLTDGPKADHQDIWRTLMKNGKNVGNCCSMNVKGFNSPGSYFLPDPWAAEQKAFPDELNIFYDVIASQVQEHSNANHKLDANSMISFLRFLATHGLKVKTASKIAQQIITDKVINKTKSWQRAVLLDKMQLDVLRHYEFKFRPDFSTFFINSTAHYQHSYWRHMDPDVFANDPPAEEVAIFKDAILFGYQQMDRLMGEFFKFEKDGILLAFATALSQQPFTEMDGIGGKRYYRPKKVETFLDRLGIQYTEINPVMANQFLAHFRGKDEAEHAANVFESLRLDDEKVIRIDPSEQPNTVFFSIRLHNSVPKDAQVQITAEPSRSFSFFELAYEMKNKKSAKHHPDGVLWFKTGRHKKHEDKISILDIYPTILNFYNIEANGESSGNVLPIQW